MLPSVHKMEGIMPPENILSWECLIGGENVPCFNFMPVGVIVGDSGLCCCCMPVVGLRVTQLFIFCLLKLGSTNEQCKCVGFFGRRIAPSTAQGHLRALKTKCRPTIANTQWRIQADDVRSTIHVFFRFYLKVTSLPTTAHLLRKSLQ